MLIEISPNERLTILASLQHRWLHLVLGDPFYPHDELPSPLGHAEIERLMAKLSKSNLITQGDTSRMSEPNHNFPDLVCRQERQALLRAVRLCDGHAILDPQAFLDAGLEPELVDACTETHKSDFSDPKRTLSQGGLPVAELRGIYGLNFLRRIASALGVPYAAKLGRGSQAHEIQRVLLAHLTLPTEA